MESAQLNKPEPCYINGDDVSNEAGLHDVAEEVHKLSLEKVPREVEESSLRTAPVLHGEFRDHILTNNVIIFPFQDNVWIMILARATSMDFMIRDMLVFFQRASYKATSMSRDMLAF